MKSYGSLSTCHLSYSVWRFSVVAPWALGHVLELLQSMGEAHDPT